MNKGNKTSRRNFTKRLVLAASAPMLTTFCTAQAPTDVQTATPDLEASKAAVKALTDLAQARYRQNVNSDDWPKIEQAIARNLATAEKLKQTKLKNSDEPATIFHL